jgi:hypothetical protein
MCVLLVTQVSVSCLCVYVCAYGSALITVLMHVVLSAPYAYLSIVVSCEAFMAVIF